jgi:hypothetical protein
MRNTRPVLTAACLVAATALSAWAVSITSSSYEGRDHFVVTTQRAVYWYDKAGGGFARIIDNDGNDWIEYHNSPCGYPDGASGCYRGLPNMQYQGTEDGAGHPGHDRCTSTSSGNVITTNSTGGNWAWTWTFTETTAENNVTKTADAYWFLYEGTPGGRAYASSNYWAAEGRSRTSGTHTNQVTGQWRWAYFGDTNVPRVLFIGQPDEDGAIDQMYYMSGGSRAGMCVFGLGRTGASEQMTAGTNRFIIGLIEETDHNTLASQIESILAGAPSMSLSPASLSFSAVAGQANPAGQNVSVTNSGSETLNAVTTSVSYGSGSGWLTASVSGSGNSQTIANAVDITGLFAATYTATVTVTCSNADPTTDTYSVSLLVKEQPVFTGVSVSPANATITTDENIQLTASALDQYDDPMDPQPTFSWSADVGSVNSSGLYTAPSTEGSATVTAEATIGGTTLSDAATIIVSEYLLFDDFQDGNADGWTAGAGTWSVSGGELGNGSTGQTSIWAGDASWTDISFTADVTPSSGTDVWMIFRVQNASNYYLYTLQTGKLYKLVGGSYSEIASGTGGYSTGTTYSITVELEGSSITVLRNGTEVLSTTDTQFSSGYVGFGSNGASGKFDNAVVQSFGGLTTRDPRVSDLTGFGQSRIVARSVESGLLFSMPVEAPHTLTLADATGRTILKRTASGRVEHLVSRGLLSAGVYMVNVTVAGRCFSKAVLVH